MMDGLPSFVTVLGISDEPAGWLSNKRSGGAILEVASGQVVSDGLCMPHSPRFHLGKLWVLNSGCGELAIVDLQTGRLTGTLNWAANDTGTTQYVDVPILSDTGFESDETFFLRLANPARLAIRSSEGFGFIINEDTTVVDASTDTTPVDITVESSLEQFSFLKNNDTLISGEFASPISLTYEGSINSADTVRYTTLGNALRPDKVRFDGGETNAVNDAFVLEGGIYRAIEMTFRTGESGLVRLAAPGAINYPESELNEFEQVVLGSAQVETVVLRVPVSYQSVTLSDVEGDPTLFQCALGGANGIANLRFSRPSGKVVVMGLDGSVTVSNQASGLTTETQRPGLYLEATAIDELEVAPNLGPMRSNEIGFESNVAYSIVPIDNAIGDFEIVNGNELKFKGTVDYETTPLLRTKVRAMSQAGAMLEAIVEIAVNNVNESPTNITISSQSLRENLGANAFVGSLSTTDPDAADSFVYSLVSGSGDTDNSFFNIHNGSIRAASNLDYEAKSSYSIRVQTQDQKGLTYAKAFSILVTNATELVSVSVNGGDVFANSNQRSQITSLVVTTDLPLVDPTVAFTLTNIGLFTSSSSILSSSQILVSTVGNVYTLRFGSGAGVETRLGSSTRSNSLSDGNWVLSVAADQVTGSNQFGTQAVDRFFRMFGDSDGDGDVDGVDSFALRRAQLTASYNPTLDWDGNGSVTSGVDLTSFSLNMNKRRRLF